MKKILFITSLFGLTLFSCTKSEPCEPTPTSLDGRWRMVIVKDNISNSEITKPSSLEGDVDIIFTTTTSTNGTFVGNTPNNILDINNYSIGPMLSMSIPNLSMTKVTETSWGDEFVENIRSTMEYNFENCGKLNIKTVKKTLTFQKQ